MYKVDVEEQFSFVVRSRQQRERGSVERFLVFVLFRSCSHCTQNEVVLVLHLLKSKEGLWREWNSSGKRRRR